MKKNFKTIIILVLLSISIVACKNNESTSKENKDEITENVEYDNEYEENQEEYAEGYEYEEFYDNLELVNLTNEEIKNLNTFFSNFSEVMLPSFSRNELTDEELINFGVFHNKINNYSRFEKDGENKIKIKKEYVDESVKKYFDTKITQAQSTNEITYSNGYYSVYESDGESYVFSQIYSLYDCLNGEFLAIVDIYVADSGWSGNRQSNPETWANDENLPELYTTVNATIRKADNKYILLEYLY